MKLSKQTTNDLLTLIEHTRRDIQYGEGGTYNDGADNVDTKEVEKVERAIDFLRNIIVLGV